MKLHPYCLLLPVIAILPLSSCIDPMMMGGSGYSNYGGGYNSYSTLPRNYSGNAYYHQGRYYTGGQHQMGNYTHQGQQYTSRYSHNGQNYYGGQHRQYQGGNWH